MIESSTDKKNEWRLKRKFRLRDKIKKQLESSLDRTPITDYDKRSKILFVLRHL